MSEATPLVTEGQDFAQPAAAKSWRCVIPQALVWQLEHYELAVYLRIAYHARPGGPGCNASVAKLSEGGLNAAKVRKALKSLAENRHVSLQRRTRTTNLVRLTREPSSRAVWLSHEVVTSLRPKELTLYARIVDSDRGTGSKKTNAVLARKLWTTARQCGNALSKLQKEGLIKVHTEGHTRVLSTATYEFRAFTTHEAAAKSVRKPGAHIEKRRLGLLGSFETPQVGNFDRGKERSDKEDPKENNNSIHVFSEITHARAKDHQAVPTSRVIKRLLEVSNYKWCRPNSATASGARPEDEAKLIKAWQEKQLQGFTFADAMAYASLVKKGILPAEDIVQSCFFGDGMSQARVHNAKKEPATVVHAVEVLVRREYLYRTDAPTVTGLTPTLEVAIAGQWQECIDAGFTLTDLLIAEKPYELHCSSADYFKRNLVAAVTNTTDVIQRMVRGRCTSAVCTKLDEGVGCDGHLHWTRDGRILAHPMTQTGEYCAACRTIAELKLRIDIQPC